MQKEMFSKVTEEDGKNIVKISEMKKVLHIVGARPQFIKVNVVINALKKHKRNIKNILLHTGQHYDKSMSDIFFKELKLNKPDFNIELINKSRISRLSEMILKIDKIIRLKKPDLILIYGDTDSTLAGAITARKKNIRLVHVEAGMRSYDIKMPEEQNRLVADKLSDYLITVSKNSTKNLIKEGNNKKKIFQYGDVMFDSLLQNKKKISKENYKFIKNPYIFFTLHRDSNSNHRTLKFIFNQMKNFKVRFFWPLHPKIYKIIKKNKIFVPKNLIINNPIGYYDTLKLISKSDFVVTDSGGVLREAYFLKKKTFILREKTEWPELIKNRSSKLIGNNLLIIKKSNKFLQSKIKSFNDLGDGQTSKKIAKLVVKLVNY